MSSNIKNPYLNNLILLFLLAWSAVILCAFNLDQYSFRLMVLVALEYIFIGYIFWRLRSSSLSLLLFIFPLFKLLYFWLYDPSWVDIGDFRIYLELLSRAFIREGLTLHSIFAATSISKEFYYLTIINMYMPMKLYGIHASSPDAGLFLFFNDFIFVALTAVTVNAFKGVLQDKLIIIIVLFLLFSPTTLADTIYPDRHIFTLFALLWFIRGVIRIRNQECRLDFYFVLSLIIIGINKPQLILAFFLYIVLDNYKLFFRWVYFVPMLALIVGFFYYNAHIHGVGRYLNNKEFNNGSYNLVLQSALGSFYIILMPIVKYMLKTIL